MSTLSNRYWLTPAVRHLAWLCSAPPLICTGPVFPVTDWLPSDVTEKLVALDQNPAALLARLDQSQSHRLGHYFEELYHFLLEAVLGWQVLLRNQPVRAANGSTLGELDFVVRNASTGHLEHHEVAVKFYLGLNQPHHCGWYGPNARDRLDLKADRMLTHQCTMSQRPETQRMLIEHGLTEPLTPALIMPGNLFLPVDESLAPNSRPPWVNSEHETGRWLYHSQLPHVDTSNWTPLRKPNWLGRLQLPGEPDEAETLKALANVASSNRPALFANVVARADRQGFEETERWFVVPEHWPEMK